MKTKATATLTILLLAASAQAQQPDQSEDAWIEPEQLDSSEDTPDVKPPAKPARGDSQAAVPVAQSPTTRKVAASESRATAEPPHHNSAHHGCNGHWHCGRHAYQSHGGSKSFALTLSKGSLHMPLLSERLDAAGYAPLSERVWLLGLEGTRIFGGGFVVGLGGQFYRTSKSESRGSNADATLEGGAFHVKLGHTLVDTRKWLVYPALQLGGYHHRVNLDASDSASFDAVLGDPARSAELSQGGAFVGGVLAVDRRLRSPWRGGNGFWSIGLRVGLTQSFWSSGWRLGDDAATNGPKDRPTLAYVGLAIGGGRLLPAKR